MTNAREEILKLTVERLQNKVESIMLGVNILLSNPERTGANIVDEAEKMMNELATTESSLNHARNLYSQCLAIRLKELSDTIENKPKEPEQ